MTRMTAERPARRDPHERGVIHDASISSESAISVKRGSGRYFGRVRALANPTVVSNFTRPGSRRARVRPGADQPRHQLPGEVRRPVLGGAEMLGQEAVAHFHAPAFVFLAWFGRHPVVVAAVVREWAGLECLGGFGGEYRNPPGDRKGGWVDGGWVCHVGYAGDGGKELRTAIQRARVVSTRAGRDA